MRSFPVHTALAIALLLGGVVACSRKGETPAARPGTAGTPAAGGRLFDVSSDRAVVIVTDGADLSGWTSTAEELARSGYRVLLLPPGDDKAAGAAADELARRGVARVVFVGSGRGVGAALAAAALGAAGVAVLNPQANGAGSATGAPPAVPSLYMASLADGPSSAAAQQLYRAAPEPRALALYPAREPAPAVFDASSELKTTFTDFIRSAFQPLSARAR